ncbi:MAG: DUF3307 domain-containing protein [Anaerolineae bacterium]|nr:DUF3307 domain-containing protein [Anaerolineae bacterium]
MKDTTMLQAIFFAHLLGDYVFQTDRIAMWKSRSIWGVLVHGGIVTAFTLLCALPFALDWWPYALLLGTIHTLIDVARTKAGKTDAATTLFLFLLDQALHVLAIVLVVSWSGWLARRPVESALGTWLQEGNRLFFAIGYVLLSMPAWVLIHFVVKGTGAESKSLPGRPGERYVGMLERGLIATFVMLGQFLLVPLVVAPRLALDGANAQIDDERIGYLGELLVSVSLAVAVGLFLRELA